MTRWKNRRLYLIACSGRDKCYSNSFLIQAYMLTRTHNVEAIDKVNKYISYRRETALQGGLVMAKSGKLELGDSIYGYYKCIFAT